MQTTGLLFPILSKQHLYISCYDNLWPDSIRSLGHYIGHLTLDLRPGWGHRRPIRSRYSHLGRDSGSPNNTSKASAGCKSAAIRRRKSCFTSSNRHSRSAERMLTWPAQRSGEAFTVALFGSRVPGTRIIGMWNRFMISVRSLIWINSPTTTLSTTTTTTACMGQVTSPSPIIAFDMRLDKNCIEHNANLCRVAPTS